MNAVASIVAAMLGGALVSIGGGQRWPAGVGLVLCIIAGFLSHP